jgi:hypothetical protein
MNNDNLFQRNKREREKQGMLHSLKKGKEKNKQKENEIRHNAAT